MQHSTASRLIRQLAGLSNFVTGQLPSAAVVLLPFILCACTISRTPDAAPSREDSMLENAVASDVLFLVLGKMSLYDQSPSGATSLRNHHFVAEIMPKAGRRIISGTLTSAVDNTQVIKFRDEGNAFLAHGARVTNAAELHRQHPDGTYYFSYQTQSGSMPRQGLTLEKRSTIDQMPTVASVTLSQNGVAALPMQIDPNTDLSLAWEPMPGNTKTTGSELEDLVFVLVFDCFGNNVAHSGRPYQGGPYLTYRDAQYTVPTASFKSGMNYTAIVEQATADSTRFQGVPGIATYATLTFLELKTTGRTEGTACP